MANFTRREKTMKTIRYELQTPTNAVELDKMLMTAARESGQHWGDDHIELTIEDNVLVLSWEVQ